MLENKLISNKWFVTNHLLTYQFFFNLLSINNKDIDISKLIELTNGKNVTKRDIFKYSKL